MANKFIICHTFLEGLSQLYVSGVSFGIDAFYFFALMKKSNKKNQSATAD